MNKFIGLFKDRYHHINKIFEVNYNNVLFNPLKNEDIALFENLHIPLTNEEFDSQITILTKATCDSFNSTFLKSKVDMSKLKIKGPMNYFKEFLIVSKKIDAQTIKRVMYGFNELQLIRSTQSLHRRGEVGEDISKQYKLVGLTNKVKFKNVLFDVIQSIEEIERIL